MEYKSVRKRSFAQREEELREIGVMHNIKGMSQREIASRMNLSQSQVSRDLKEIHKRFDSSVLESKERMRSSMVKTIDYCIQQCVKHCSPKASIPLAAKFLELKAKLIGAYHAENEIPTQINVIEIRQCPEQGGQNPAGPEEKQLPAAG